MLRRHSHARIELKRRLAEVLEEQVGDRPGRIVGRLIVLLILVNLVAVTLESVPNLAARYGMLFSTIELASSASCTSNSATSLTIRCNNQSRTIGLAFKRHTFFCELISRVCP